MVTSVGEATWQLTLQRRNKMWVIVAAPIGATTKGINPLMSTAFYTAKEARIAADKFFPSIAWANSKKGYVKVTAE